MNLLMNDKGVCRTSPATMGLLNIFKHVPVIAVILIEEEKVIQILSKYYPIYYPISNIIQIYNHTIDMYQFVYVFFDIFFSSFLQGPSCFVFQSQELKVFIRPYSFYTVVFPNWIYDSINHKISHEKQYIKSTKTQTCKKTFQPKYFVKTNFTHTKKNTKNNTPNIIKKMIKSKI